MPLFWWCQQIKKLVEHQQNNDFGSSANCAIIKFNYNKNSFNCVTCIEINTVSVIKNPILKNLFILLFLWSILLTSCSSTSGTVKGTVCYPAEYIPAMIVYLKNKETSKIYSLDIEENQKPFKFKKMPAGNYIAFANTVQEISTDSNNKSTIASGGYTHAVPCGLTADCEDHSLLIFKVQNGKTTKKIEICDWLGAIMQDEK